MNYCLKRYIDPMKNIILFLSIVSISLNAFACSFPNRNDEEKFANADRVFRAKIIATKLVTEEIHGDKGEVIHATYKLIESYKGKTPQEGIVRELPFGPGNCMIGLMTGTEYIIYIDNKYNFVTLPSGSWGYFNAEGTEVQSKINELRERAKKIM